MLPKISTNRKRLRKEPSRPDRTIDEMTTAVREFLRLATVIHPTAAVVILKTADGRKLKLRLN